MKTFVTISILLLSSIALADEVKCVSGADERVLSISSVDSGCKLEYSKAGNQSILATQKVGLTKCEEIRDSVKAKLEGAGYKCDAGTEDAATATTSPTPTTVK